MCKRLRCVHVNKHALLLVGRTCVANLLKTCDYRDSTPVRTQTSLPSKLTKELIGIITHMGGKKTMKTKLLFSSIQAKGCTFMNTPKRVGLKKNDLNLFKQDVEDSVWCLISSSALSIIPLSRRHTPFLILSAICSQQEVMTL